MKIIDYFDRIYVINLPERKDRYRRVIWQLKQVGLWGTQKTRIFPAIRPTEAAGFTDIGVRGCFLSHLAVLKSAREDRMKNVLIMEDDLIFSPRFKICEENFVDQLARTSWGFVYFGHGEAQPPGTTITTLHSSHGPVSFTHFYGINSIIYDRLIAFLERIQLCRPGDPSGSPMSPDAAYSTFRRQNSDVVTLLAIPSLGRQGSSKTDLGKEKWFDRIPVLGRIVGIIRTLKVYVEVWLSDISR